MVPMIFGSLAALSEEEWGGKAMDEEEMLILRQRRMQTAKRTIVL